MNHIFTRFFTPSPLCPLEGLLIDLLQGPFASKHFEALQRKHLITAIKRLQAIP